MQSMRICHRSRSDMAVIPEKYMRISTLMTAVSAHGNGVSGSGESDDEKNGKRLTATQRKFTIYIK